MIEENSDYVKEAVHSYHELIISTLWQIVTNVEMWIMLVSSFIIVILNKWLWKFPAGVNLGFCSNNVNLNVLKIQL